ncbi:hypothetical protein [uncultured Dokdonia sp.]|uniref:hypothetical protein n=1 Tax=uncultured Dokdonia sp. TaxID=575653 RepID=UPI002604D130|nr:hypothetical protein [uncultured Dokdonia sp.]
MSTHEDPKVKVTKVILFIVVGAFIMYHQKYKMPKETVYDLPVKYETKTLGWILQVKKTDGYRKSSSTITYQYLIEGEWKRKKRTIENKYIDQVDLRKGTYYYVGYDEQNTNNSQLLITEPISKREGRKMRDSILNLYNK